MKNQKFKILQIIYQKIKNIQTYYLNIKNGNNIINYYKFNNNNNNNNNNIKCINKINRK